MAERPVFIPSYTGAQLVQEVRVQFHWHPGLAASQKKKNVVELHASAAEHGLGPLLEISSKSELEVGQKLSAFHLKVDVIGRQTTVECAYQGSKVFEHGGPYTDLYWKESREAKRDSRLKDSGKLVGFEFSGRKYPISPMTVFYDWLYFLALYPHRDWLERHNDWAGFTDIEFNPDRSLNCQARSFAAFVALIKRDQLDKTVATFEDFRERWETAGL